MATSISSSEDSLPKTWILSDAGNQILQSLPRNFSYVVVEEDLDDEDDEGSEDRGPVHKPCLVIRSSMSTVKQVERWIAAFQQNTLTRWIVARGTQDPTRFVFRRQWSCQHSKLNKGRSKEKSKSTNCKAKLDIKIKLQTCDTRKKDAYLKLRPAHPAIIKICYKHNHGTEFVERRENFLSELAQSQLELKRELARLNDLLTKSKPAHSAIRQLTNALKQIHTEAELFEAMRKVRLKTNNFVSGAGRPKRKPDEVPKSSSKKAKNEQSTGSVDSDGMSEVIFSILPIEQDTEQFSDITTISTEQEEEQTLDISFLLTNSPSPLSNSTPFT